MATRWGILGTGQISHDFVVCLNALPKEQHQIVAVATLFFEEAKEFATRHNIHQAYRTFQEVAEDPNVEVAYVGMINTQHLPVVKCMLSHGKHVLCEKPLGLSATDTREMVTLARIQNRFLMEGIWNRYSPTYERLQQEIAAGKLGRVVQVNATACKKMDQVERIIKKELGGGITLDMGIYTIAMALMAFGGHRPNKITAIGHINSSGVEEAVSAGLLFDNGQLASLNFSLKCTATSEARIIGTDGEATLSDKFWCTNTLTLPSGQVISVKLPHVNDRLVFENGQGMIYEAQEVRKCIKSGSIESPRMKHDESILLAEIMDDIRQQVGVSM